MACLEQIDESEAGHIDRDGAGLVESGKKRLRFHTCMKAVGEGIKEFVGMYTVSQNLI